MKMKQKVLLAFYDEDRALVTLYSDGKKYLYKDVPLCVWWRIKKLNGKGVIGLIYKILKSYSDRRR